MTREGGGGGAAASQREWQRLDELDGGLGDGPKKTSSFAVRGIAGGGATSPTRRGEVEAAGFRQRWSGHRRPLYRPNGVRTAPPRSANPDMTPGDIVAARRAPPAADFPNQKQNPSSVFCPRKIDRK
jgi:hypothetical protein